MALRTGDLDLSPASAQIPGAAKRDLEFGPIFYFILFFYKACLFRCSSCSWNSRINGVIAYHLICVHPLLRTYLYLPPAGILDYAGITGNLSRFGICLVVWPVW